jgi:hypothetical protein
MLLSPQRMWRRFPGAKGLPQIEREAPNSGESGASLFTGCLHHICDGPNQLSIDRTEREHARACRSGRHTLRSGHRPLHHKQRAVAGCELSGPPLASRAGLAQARCPDPLVMTPISGSRLPLQDRLTSPNSGPAIDSGPPAGIVDTRRDFSGSGSSPMP